MADPVELTDPIADDLAFMVEHLAAYASSNPLVDSEGLTATVTHGTEFVVDHCCPAAAWVRITSVFPSLSFPNPISGEVRCPPPSWAATIELGIVRCASALPDDSGNPPPIEDIAFDAAVANYDRSALIQLVICRIAPRYDGIIAMDPWQPMDTSGGCFGSTVEITIPVPFCCDPALES